jgi:hypothetical protein
MPNLEIWLARLSHAELIRGKYMFNMFFLVLTLLAKHNVYSSSSMRILFNLCCGISEKTAVKRWTNFLKGVSIILVNTILQKTLQH